MDDLQSSRPIPSVSASNCIYAHPARPPSTPCPPVSLIHTSLPSSSPPLTLPNPQPSLHHGPARRGYPRPSSSFLPSHHPRWLQLPRNQQCLFRQRPAQRGLDQDLGPCREAADTEQNRPAQLQYVSTAPRAHRAIGLTSHRREEAEEATRGPRAQSWLRVFVARAQARGAAFEIESKDGQPQATPVTVSSSCSGPVVGHWRRLDHVRGPAHEARLPVAAALFSPHPRRVAAPAIAASASARYISGHDRLDPRGELPVSAPHATILRPSHAVPVAGQAATDQTRSISPDRHGHARLYARRRLYAFWLRAHGYLAGESSAHEPVEQTSKPAQLLIAHQTPELCDMYEYNSSAGSPSAFPQTPPLIMSLSPPFTPSFEL